MRAGFSFMELLFIVALIGIRAAIKVAGYEGHMDPTKNRALGAYN